MHNLGKLRSGWCNPSESYVSYSSILEEAARVFVTSLMYAFLNWWVLDMASAGASGSLTGEDQRSYIKIETLRGKTPTEIVAIDETWFRDFEPELKSQSNEWRSPSSPWPKKFWRAQSKVKKMMIFAYDHRGIIMTDRVPCGTSVTAAYYRDWMQELRRKMHKTDLTCSGMGHSFCTTTHAHTWGRLWPICWVNTSGKCYLTRHTVQTWVHRTSTYMYFPS